MHNHEPCSHIHGRFYCVCGAVRNADLTWSMPECSPECGQVTWCVDRINDTDVEYKVVRAGANFRPSKRT